MFDKFNAHLLNQQSNFMKNLKFLFVMFALGVFMASCVDIEEPKGIEEVRGAKVEFLKAQAALQLAEAKLTEAKAATELANAKLQEAYAKEIEIQNSANETQNAFEKARLDLELQKLQVNNQLMIINVQRQTAEARIAYEQALAELKIAQTVGVPQMYMDKLDEVKNELSNIMSEINWVEGNIVSVNLSLNLWVARDSVNYDYNLRRSIAAKTKELQMAKDYLTLVTDLKNANQADRDNQKTAATAKIKELNIEKSATDTKIATLNAEVTNLINQNNNISFQLNDKVDYSTTVAVPSAIKDIVKSSSYGGLMKSDLSAIVYVSSLNDVLNMLTNLKTYATDQKNANPTVAEWDTFIASITTEYDRLNGIRTNLQAEQTDLLITLAQKNAELATQNNYLNIVNNYISEYTMVVDALNNSMFSFDSQIEYAQNEVNNLQADLDGLNVNLKAWEKGYTADPWGNFENVKAEYQRQLAQMESNLNRLKDRFDALTKQKDELVKLINDYNK